MIVKTYCEIKCETNGVLYSTTDRSTGVMTCACEKEEEMYLQLRGLCPDSNIDNFYVPKNKRDSGVVLLIGLNTCEIEYDKDTLSWVLTDHSQNTTAVSNAPLDSYALGSHTWSIENDYQACSPKGRENIDLHLLLCYCLVMSHSRC